MLPLLIPTDYVLDNELAWSLKELDLQSPGSRGWRRYRIVTVWREPYLCEFRTDLGPRSRFKLDQFNIVAGVWTNNRPECLYNVAEVLDMADRMHVGYMAETERPEPSNLIERFHDQQELKGLVRRRLSSFGWGGSKQRN